MRSSFELLPKAACAVLLALALCACSTKTTKSYNDGDVRQLHGVYTGTVLDATDITVTEDPSLVGPIVGGVAGGVVGSFFGAGTGNALAVLGGAAAGAMIGGAEDMGQRKYPALQLTIELENGGTVMVVQAHDDYFVRGDRVRMVITGENRARIQHL